MSKPWMKFYDSNVLDNVLPNKTLYGDIKSSVTDYDKVAISYLGVDISYKELFVNVDKCACAFKRIGIKRGDVVTICMVTTPELIYLLYALNKLGAVCNMIDPRKSVNEIYEYTHEVNSKLFIGLDLFLDKYSKVDVNIIEVSLFESLKGIKKKIMTFNKKNKYMTFNKLMLYSDDSVIVDEYIKDTSAVIVHTGGTTGKSKGVFLSNDNITSTAFQCGLLGLNFADKGKWLCIMPPFIAYAICDSIHFSLRNNMTLLLVPNFKVENFDKIILKFKPNYMAGTPIHYISLLKSDRLKNKDLSFIKVPVVGGDELDPVLEDKINVFFKSHNVDTDIVKGYGMTEGSASITVSNYKSNKVGSVGIPLPFTCVTVNDISTGEVIYNKPGEIRVSGPNVMVGYYDKSDDDEVIHYENGIRTIYTKDCGKMDDDGRLYIIDRYKEIIIKSDGFKVFPNEVEKVIETHKDIVYCEVVGIKDNDNVVGSVPYAFIKINKDVKNVNKLVDELKKLCISNLSSYSLPYEFIVVDEFPKTSIGKTDVEALKKLVSNDKKNIEKSE